LAKEGTLPLTLSKLSDGDYYIKVLSLDGTGANALYNTKYTLTAKAA